jgi:hypothetical protein
MNGGVTDPQQMHWVNPRTGSYLMSTGGNHNAVAFDDGITCPGYRGTVVGAWQVWGVYVPLTGEAAEPNMRTNFRSV